MHINVRNNPAHMTSTADEPKRDTRKATWTLRNCKSLKGWHGIQLENCSNTLVTRDKILKKRGNTVPV